MKIRLSLVLAVLALFVAAWGLAVVSGYASGAHDAARRDADIERALVAGGPV